MKKLLSLKYQIIVILAVLAIAGCVAKNPNYNSTVPISAGNEPYAADVSSLSNRMVQAKALLGYAAPFNPAIPAAGNSLLDGILGVATLVSGGLAYFKNKSAAKHSAAATSLAQTVKASSIQAQALANAATPAVAATIAEHLQNT